MTTVAAPSGRREWSLKTVMVVLAILILFQVAQQAYLISLGFGFGPNVLGPLVAYPVGALIWTMLVYKIAHGLNPNVPKFSRYLELYLVTSLLMAGVLILHLAVNLWSSADPGNPIFGPPYRIYMYGKLVHLLVFFIAGIRISLVEAAAPPPRLSTGRGGVA